MVIIPSLAAPDGLRPVVILPLPSPGVFIPRPHPTAAVNLHKQGVRRKKLRSYITYRAQAKLSKKSAKWKGKEEVSAKCSIIWDRIS